MAMLPVAQLYARDVPDLHAPEGADLLQVLWCPFDHQAMPRTALFWRSAATVTGILTTPPEPPVMQSDGYLPEPCLLYPEQVTEYPDHLELSKEHRERLGSWTAWQTVVADVEEYASSAGVYYDQELASAPGWKVGGWPRWGATDPVPRLCPACGSDMDALLTIASYESLANSGSWIPDEACEDRERTSPNSNDIGPEGQELIDFFRAQGREVQLRGHIPARAHATPVNVNPAPRQPTAIQLADGSDQQLYICPADPEHPHAEMMH